MNTPNKITKEYRIEAGNSGTGPVGFVLYTKAESPEAALAWAKEEVIRYSYSLDVGDSETGEPSELYAYFNPDLLTLADVWEVQSDRRCASPDPTAADRMFAALVMIEESEQDLKNGLLPRHSFNQIMMARDLALAAARKGQS